MEIEYQDILTLSDNHQYVVASKVDYHQSKYAYLVDINNSESVKFVELEDDGTLSELDDVIDEELIQELIPLCYQFSKDDIESVE